MSECLILWCLSLTLTRRTDVRRSREARTSIASEPNLLTLFYFAEVCENLHLRYPEFSSPLQRDSTNILETGKQRPLITSVHINPGGREGRNINRQETVELATQGVRNLENTGTHSAALFAAENMKSLVCCPQSPGGLALGGAQKCQGHWH